MTWWVLSILLVLAAFGLYVLLEMFMIYQEEKRKVDRSPRAEMFLCNKHGLFPKEHCLQLFPELGPDIQNAWICPTCYREKVFIEPDKKLYN